jgi:putative ABC transport system permease protein
MNLFEIFRTAVESLWANKLRTALTMLGVIIGVGSVVTLLAIGTGVGNNITSRIQSNGTNLLSIQPDNRASSSARLTADDVDALSKVSQLKAVIPSVTGNSRVVAGLESQSASVNGTLPAYLEARSLTVEEGEAFTVDDSDARKRVAVLGATLAEELFPDGNAIGETILIANVPFKVTGVLTSSGGAFGNSPDDTVYVPLSVAQEKLFPKRNGGLYSISSIAAVLRSEDESAAAQTAITSVLREQHNLESSQADDFRIFNQAQLAETLSSVATTLTAFLGAIGAISLIVGGIGIMNIMLVSVTERTREIGVRKAIGARRGSVRLQFLIEALTVTIIAGLIGIGMGVGISALVGSLQTSFVPVVNISTIIIAFAVSVLIGVIFGLYPAWRASLLSPVEALRYE